MLDPSDNLSAYSRIVDPAVAWALGAGSSFYFYFTPEPKTWMPILLRLDKVSPADFAAGIGPDGKPFVSKLRLKWWTESVMIPDFYKRSEQGQKSAEFCTALVPSEFFDYFKKNKQLHELVVNITLGLPLPADSVPPAPKPPPEPKQSKPKPPARKRRLR